MLLERFIQLTDVHPDMIFLKGKNYNITFEELSFAIGSRSKSLTGVGIVSGLRIAIVLDESRDILEILLSCWQLGAIPILISPNATIDEFSSFISCSQPDMIITNWRISEDLRHSDVPVFPIEELSQGFGGCVPARFYNKLDINQIRLILFTSGSTGTPKAVKLTERNLIESATKWHEEIQFRKNDIYLNCLPLNHIGGISIFIRSLIYGFSTYQLNIFNIQNITSLLKSEKISLVSMVPTMLQRLLDEAKNKLPSSLRGLIISGGPSSKALMDRCIVHNVPVYKSYGMTETSSGICGFWLKDYPSKFDSVGLPFIKTKCKINNSVLHISSSTIMGGYFQEEPIGDWFETGDFACIDDEGFIYIDMRRNDRIVTGGENVNPEEVEKILLSHPQITFAKVYGEPNEEWGRMVVAEISTDLKTDEIYTWLLGKVSDYKIPKVIYLK